MILQVEGATTVQGELRVCHQRGLSTGSHLESAELMSGRVIGVDPSCLWGPEPQLSC